MTEVETKRKVMGRRTKEAKRSGKRAWQVQRGGKQEDNWKEWVVTASQIYQFFFVYTHKKIQNQRWIFGKHCNVQNLYSLINMCPEKRFHVKMSILMCLQNCSSFSQVPRPEGKLNRQMQKLWCIKRAKWGAEQGANEKWLRESERRRETLTRHDLSDSGQMRKNTGWYRLSFVTLLLKTDTLTSGLENSAQGWH